MKNKTLLFCLVPFFLMAQNRKIETVHEAYIAYEITTPGGESDFEEFLITDKTPEKVIRDYLNYHAFSAIQFNTDSLSPYPFRVQLNKGNWILYSHYDADFKPSKEEKNLSFDFPIQQFSDQLTFVTNKKNQQALFRLEEEMLTDFYDEIKITNQQEFFKNLKEYNHLKAQIDSVFLQVTDTESNQLFEAEQFANELEYEIAQLIQSLQIERIQFAVRRKNKWARFVYLLNDDLFMPYTPFVYENSEDLPQAELPSNEAQQPVVGFLAKNYNAVDFEFLDSWGYAIKFNDFKTKKIGFYYGEGEQEPSLSANYDDIRIEQKAECLLVSSKEKWGVFNFNGEEILPVQYDTIEIIFLDFTYGLIAQKNNQWSLVDAQFGDLLLENNYPSEEELMQAWRNR